MEADLGKCWNCKSRPGTIQCPTCRFAVYCFWNCLQQDQYRHKVECLNAVTVKSCHKCGCFSDKLKCCKGCYSAFYCGVQCQTSHWPSHKNKCLELGKYILHCAAVRQQMPSFCGLPWLVGATLAEDYLRLPQNEGINTERNLRLMFIGVGDIRNVACTIACLPSEFRGELEFVLNDISPHIMARNLVFLYYAITRKDAHKLVQIWYSVTLTEACVDFLVKMLKELVTQPRKSLLSIMHNLVDISEEHWQQCVVIWEAWIRLSLDANAGKRFQKERECKIQNQIDNLMMMMEFAPQEHVQSLEEFINTGILLPLKSHLRKKAVHVNPTMGCFNPFNPDHSSKCQDVNSIYPHRACWGFSFPYDTEMIYGVRQDCLAFACWDYQVVKKTVGLKDDLNEMYNTYLKQVFTAVFKNLDKKKIQFSLVVDSFEKMDECLLQNKRFDRICTSNLSDYIPIPRLLKQLGPFLNRKNPCAVLMSYHQNWGSYTQVYDTGTEQSIEAGKLAVHDCIARPEVMPSQQMVTNPLLFCYQVLTSGYIDTYPDFLISYLAEILLYLHESENVPFAKSSLAKICTIPHKFGLRLRDYRKELNRVVPFYRESFARRVELNRSSKRCLEWVPL